MKESEEFNEIFNKKVEDISDILIQGFNTGVYDNRNKATFTHEDLTGSIKISTDVSPIDETVEFGEFMVEFKDRVLILKNQVFYALDKRIFDNRVHKRFSNQGIYCSITLKTSTRSEEEKTYKKVLKEIYDAQDHGIGNNNDPEDSKSMTI
jgi:hypothetical protein